MESNKSEQLEALETLCQVNDRLLKNLPTIIDELSGERQSDTDKYLTSVVDTINWEITVLNATAALLEEEGAAFDKECFNQSVNTLGAALSAKKDAEIAEALQGLIPHFETLGAEIKSIIT